MILSIPRLTANRKQVLAVTLAKPDPKTYGIAVFEGFCEFRVNRKMNKSIKSGKTLLPTEAHGSVSFDVFSITTKNPPKPNPAKIPSFRPLSEPVKV